MGVSGDIYLDDPEIRRAVDATAGMAADRFAELSEDRKRDAVRKWEKAKQEHQKAQEKKVMTVEAAAEIYQIFDSSAKRLNQQEQLLDDKPDRLVITPGTPMRLEVIEAEMPNVSQFLHDAVVIGSIAKDKEFLISRAQLKAIDVNQERPGTATIEFVLIDSGAPEVERRVGIKVGNTDVPVLGTTWKNESAGISHDATDRTDYSREEYRAMSGACRDVKRYVEYYAKTGTVTANLNSNS